MDCSLTDVCCLHTLAPAKIDKTKIAEILPFSAGLDYFCHPKRGGSKPPPYDAALSC